MHISLNELKETTIRAASSVGLPPGLADEAGILALRILRSSIEGDPVLGDIGDLVEALEALDREDSFRFAKTPASAGHFIAQKAKAPLSSLWCGPSLGDRLIVAATDDDHHETGVIACVEAVDIPSLIVHPLLRASREIEGLVRIACRSRAALASPTMKKTELTCHRGRLRSMGMPLRGPAWMSIRMDPPPPGITGQTLDKRLGNPNEAMGKGMGGEIEKTLWRRLCILAEKQLVANSERSRLTGAGAGVVDRD